MGLQSTALIKNTPCFGDLPEDLFSRREVFDIPHAMIYDNPVMVMAILGAVLVTRAEFHFPKSVMRYDAYGPEFELLPDGAPPNEYYLSATVKLDELAGETTTVLSWVKIDKVGYGA